MGSSFQLANINHVEASNLAGHYADQGKSPAISRKTNVKNAVSKEPALARSDISSKLVEEAATEARRVIHEERLGLQQLEEMINESFCQAALMLLTLPGRIIVTGLGKSGHIGRKIASTLASTGSPAFFLHPGDFNHGELGAINRGDAMIMLSRSGDVPELFQTIARCHRLSIPLVSITAKAASKLAMDSNAVLLIPDIPEACPHGLAPTTSAVAMLAMGDALAMFMMKRRAFTERDFKFNHPGGNIGRRALSVREMLLNKELSNQTMPPNIFLTTLFSEASSTVLCSEYSIASVVDDVGRIIDVLTGQHIGMAMLESFPADWCVGKVLERLKMKNPKKFMLAIDDFTSETDGQVSMLVNKMNRNNLPGIFIVNEDGYKFNYLPLKACLSAGISHEK